MISTLQTNRQLLASVVGQLTVPIYQGGGEYSAIRQSKNRWASNGSTST